MADGKIAYKSSFTDFYADFYADFDNATKGKHLDIKTLDTFSLMELFSGSQRSDTLFRMLSRSSRPVIDEYISSSSC